MKENKLLLISHTLPPKNIVVSFLLARIFSHFDKHSYVIYTTLSAKQGRIDSDPLPCRYYYAPAKDIYEGYSRWGEWLEVIPMVIEGLKVIKKEQISSILVCPETGNELLAAYVMHKLTKLPLYIYFFDAYSAAQRYKLRKIMSIYIERLAVKAAKKIFVMSEALQDYYLKKYGKGSIVLPHPVDTEQYKTEDGYREAVNNGKKKIVYTGMIYGAHYDAFFNLVKTIRDMENVELHIYSRRTPEELAKIGIQAPNVINHGLMSQDKIPGIQMSADILFMPLAFKSPYPDVIKTASPGKLPEYLAAGRPILVHAPKESYISWYAKKYGWGLVVDELNTELLANAIKTLINNDSVKKQLIENSLQTVKLHESARVANILMSELK